jgi:type III secretion protein J
MSATLRCRVPLLLLLCTAACRERIQHGLDERQANELQTVLIERGLDARKVPGAGKKPTWAIEVAEEQASDAVRILAELGLPRPVAEAGCDVFGGGGLIRSPVEEQLCRIQVLERGLEKTLQTVEGVLIARVHLMVPPPPRPGQVPAAAKASAMLRAAPGKAARIRQSQELLRALIAGGVEGLSPEAVSLLVDEATTRVEVTDTRSSPLMRLRVLLAVMGVVLTGLAGALVFVALRLRSSQVQAAPQPVAPPVPARPVVAANVARKVA